MIIKCLELFPYFQIRYEEFYRRKGEVETTGTRQV